ncbi:hypothetical protein H0H93_002866, partial [Arthromyces matolae]
MFVAYTYKYFRTQRTQRRLASSNHATQPVIQNNDSSLQSILRQPIQDNLSPLQLPIENYPSPLQAAIEENGTPLQSPDYNNVPTVEGRPRNFEPPLQITNSLQPTLQGDASPPQASIISNGPPLHPPSHHNVPAQSLVPNIGQPVQNTNAAPPQGPRMSLRDYEALPPEDRPHHEIRTSLRPANGADIHPCSVFMESSTSSIRLTIDSGATNGALRSLYERSMSMLRERSDPRVTLFVDLGNNASSTHFGDVNNALTRLARDDAHHRCKTLNVMLPSRGKHAVPGVDDDPISLTLPQVQTLFWRSDQQDIPMMNPATLTHLTNLTLRTTITFQDCHYILGCIQNTVQHFDARTLYESSVTNMLPNPYSDKKKTPVLRQLESLSIVATSSPEGFLNNLRLYGGKLKTLTIDVPSHIIDPEAM